MCLIVNLFFPPRVFERDSLSDCAFSLSLPTCNFFSVLVPGLESIFVFDETRRRLVRFRLQSSSRSFSYTFPRCQWQFYLFIPSFCHIFLHYFLAEGAITQFQFLNHHAVFFFLRLVRFSGSFRICFICTHC